MTVQEMIDALSKIEDKSIDVAVFRIEDFDETSTTCNYGVVRKVKTCLALPENDDGEGNHKYEGVSNNYIPYNTQPGIPIVELELW